jgi:hypothetical protein
MSERIEGLTPMVREALLFLDTDKGQGATQEQFEALFRSAGIIVVYKHSVYATAARLGSLDSRPFPHSAIRYGSRRYRTESDDRPRTSVKRFELLNFLV